MAKFKLNGVGIEGIACAVPKRVVDNSEFYDAFTREYVDKFIETTGVKQTHRTREQQTASDLCFVAAEELFQKKQLDKNEIGAVIFVSQTPDYRLPPTACVLHHRLDLSKECIAFDINLGCSGWVYGVNAVGSLMIASDIKKALLLFGDTNVKTISPKDKSSYMLFGEAGSVTLLVNNGKDDIKGELLTDGSGYKTIIQYAGAYRKMNANHEPFEWEDGNIRSEYDAFINGTDVFSFTITQVPKLIKKHLTKGNSNQNAYNALVLHQANLYIMKQIAKKTKFDMEKVPVTIDRFGNTSGTSIPLTICDQYGKAREAGRLHLLMCGYGVGLSWGVVDAYIDKSDIFEIVYTDDYYTEGELNHE